MSGFSGERDRAIGSLLGLAIGDAIGTTVEFRARDSYEPLTGVVGGGPFNLEAGQWTDDTAMALALSESLIECGELSETDLLSRFDDWYRHGRYSCTGECFDIGVTTRQALERWHETGNIHAGSRDPRSAGNGSLMRLAPVAIRFWNDTNRRAEAAARQSRTTHGAPEAVDACIAFADCLAAAIGGNDRESVLNEQRPGLAPSVAAILGGSWKNKTRTEIRSSGYVLHSLEAAFWCVAQTGTFADAVLLAANLGDDADTTAAIAGQLAGALYGAHAIPAALATPLAWRERIEDAAKKLFDASVGGDWP